MAWKFIAMLTSTALGPLLAIILVSCWGDDWSRSQLTAVFLAGQGMALLACVFLLFFDDTKSLGKSSESLALDSDTEESKQFICCCRSQPYCLTIKSIPLLMLCSDIALGLASGMTIKFFPLFFKVLCIEISDALQIIPFLDFHCDLRMK